MIGRFGASFPGAPVGHVVPCTGFMSFSKLLNICCKKSYLFDVSFSLSNLLSMHMMYSFFIGCVFIEYLHIKVNVLVKNLQDFLCLSIGFFQTILVYNL